jgi:two-component system, NarL family, nitrate/nitrite response regulator NarL
MVGAAMIDVLVCDGHPLFLDGLVRVIRQDRELRLVAEAADGSSALAAIRAHRPDVALVAEDLGDLGAARLLGALAREGAATRVVLLHAAPATVAWDTLGRGAAGVLSRRVSADGVRAAVREVARGEVALCPEAQAALAAEIRVRRPSEGPALSRRELEVLRLIAEGASAPAIAGHLQVATTTVRTHCQRLREKLEAKDRAQLVYRAMRLNLLD